MAPPGALALTAAERVVDGVHRDAARVRALALPTVATGLADRDQARLAVADLADGRPAVDRHAAHLRGRETQRREQAFLRELLLELLEPIDGWQVEGKDTEPA